MMMVASPTGSWRKWASFLTLSFMTFCEGGSAVGRSVSSLPKLSVALSCPTRVREAFVNEVVAPLLSEQYNQRAVSSLLWADHHRDTTITRLVVEYWKEELEPRCREEVDARASRANRPELLARLLVVFDRFQRPLPNHFPRGRAPDMWHAFSWQRMSGDEDPKRRLESYQRFARPVLRELSRSVPDMRLTDRHAQQLPYSPSIFLAILEKAVVVAIFAQRSRPGPAPVLTESLVARHMLGREALFTAMLRSKENPNLQGNLIGTSELITRILDCKGYIECWLHKSGAAREDRASNASLRVRLHIIAILIRLNSAPRYDSELVASLRNVDGAGARSTWARELPSYAALRRFHGFMAEAPTKLSMYEYRERFVYGFSQLLNALGDRPLVLHTPITKPPPEYKKCPGVAVITVATLPDPVFSLAALFGSGPAPAAAPPNARRESTDAGDRRESSSGESRADEAGTGGGGEDASAQAQGSAPMGREESGGSEGAGEGGDGKEEDGEEEDEGDDAVPAPPVEADEDQHDEAAQRRLVEFDLSKAYREQVRRLWEGGEPLFPEGDPRMEDEYRELFLNQGVDLRGRVQSKKADLALLQDPELKDEHLTKVRKQEVPSESWVLLVYSWAADVDPHVKISLKRFRLIGAPFLCPMREQLVTDHPDLWADVPFLRGAALDAQGQLEAVEERLEVKACLRDNPTHQALEGLVDEAKEVLEKIEDDYRTAINVARKRLKRRS
jgi:hypothetical protein